MSDRNSNQSTNGNSNTVGSFGFTRNDQQSSGEQTPAPATQEANANPAPQQRQSPLEMFKSFAVRMLIFYFISQYFRRPQTNQNSTNGPGPMMPNSQFIPGNLFANGALMDMHLFINENEDYHYENAGKPIWTIDGFKYGDWTPTGTFTKFFEFPISENVQNNGSLFLHVVVTKHGYSIDPEDRDSYSRQYTFYKSKRLNKYKKKVYKRTKNLLTGSSQNDEEYLKKADENVVELLSHWHPNMTINLLDDQSPWAKGSIPPPMDKFFEFDLLTGKYYPVLYLNDYWNLLADYYPVNSTFEKLNLTVTVAPIQLWKWQMYISQNMRNSWYGNILGEEENDDDQDAMKRAMVETNPYLLGVTIVVSIIHTIFEILAFKNDIQFWRTRKSLEGLSVRSVFFNIFQSFIVLLYVFDNETNTMVRISVCVGILIELWKVPKVLNLQRVPNERVFGIFPKYKYLYKDSYTETSTSDYDRMAFKYLSLILFPLVVVYACYQLWYHEQKSWYSFCLSTVYGFLLTFGFIMMTPQLFINYKLKSVSHLPWRMMTYKALNTFIDDLFAFVIKMPTMYRLGCFRDDIIFFIYLYQRYIYPVDRTRLNEYGTSGETDSAVVPSDEAQANAEQHEKTD